MTETAPPLPSPSSSSNSSSRKHGGVGKSSFSKSIFLCMFMAGLLTTATWSHYLTEFYSYDAILLQTTSLSKATFESIEVMSALMDTAVKAPTDVATTAVVLTGGAGGAGSNHDDKTTDTTISLQQEKKRPSTSTTRTNSAPVTVERIPTSIDDSPQASITSAPSKGLNRLTDIYEAIANVTRHGGVPWPNPKRSNDTCQHYTVLTRHEYAKDHNITTKSIPTTTAINLTSSVEFIGCCGLGHRLSRMAGAAHIAHELETTLLSHWGCCGNTDVFYDLFGFDPILFGQRITPRPPPLPILPAVHNNESETTPQRPQQHNNNQHHHMYHLQFRFETPPFQTLKKADVHCPCTQDKMDSDFDFYSTLRNRYTRKHQIQAFVRRHFYNHTSIGLHIR
jgi:hypothetical protein